MTDTKKKLLLLSYEYPYRPGEASFIEPELAALGARYEVRIAACLGDGTSTDSPVPCPVPYAPAGKCGFLRGLISVLADPAFWRDLVTAAKTSPFSLFRRRAGLVFYCYLHAHRFALSLEKTLFADFMPDVVYSFWGRESAYTALLLKRRRPGIAALSRFHGFDLYQERSAAKLLPFRTALGRGLDACLFVSDHGKRYFTAACPGIPTEKLYVFRLGCPAAPGRIQPDFSHFTIVSCSRVMPEKRLSLLVQALANVEGVRIDWHHIGSGACLAEITALSESLLGRKSNVSFTFHGMLENAAIAPLYAALGARLFVNVSESEGLPVTMMEAFSVGLPVLGTDVGGVSELVTPDTGVLLDPNPAPETVAAALSAFAALSESEWQSRSDAAFAKWKAGYCAERNAARLADFISAL